MNEGNLVKSTSQVLESSNVSAIHESSLSGAIRVVSEPHLSDGSLIESGSGWQRGTIDVNSAIGECNSLVSIGFLGDHSRGEEVLGSDHVAHESLCGPVDQDNCAISVSHSRNVLAFDPL